MKDQRPDKQVESLITGGACSARSQFHKAPVYIIEEGSTVPAGLRATQIKCTSCKIQRDPRARANGSEPLSFFKNFHAPYLPPPPFSPLPLSPARHEIRSRPINKVHTTSFPSLEEISSSRDLCKKSKSGSKEESNYRFLGNSQRKSDIEGSGDHSTSF